MELLSVYTTVLTTLISMVDKVSLHLVFKTKISTDILTNRHLTNPEKYTIKIKVSPIKMNVSKWTLHTLVAFTNILKTKMEVISFKA